MEPNPKNKTVYNLSINWTQDCNTWPSSQLRKDIQQLCDQLYVKAASQQNIKTIENIDQTVVGDIHPQAFEMIMSAYRKYKEV
jgi:alpha-acetolactate decarboxylase